MKDIMKNIGFVMLAILALFIVATVFPVLIWWLDKLSTWLGVKP